jgi:hypothetical protein
MEPWGGRAGVCESSLVHPKPRAPTCSWACSSISSKARHRSPVMVWIARRLVSVYLQGGRAGGSEGRSARAALGGCFSRLLPAQLHTARPSRALRLS